MKQILIYTGLLVSMCNSLVAQKQIKDKHITNQQERMVFKQWDRKKFTPTSGFLGLNPEYWLTWAWHPNYPKTDLRPLGPVGPQTQRLAFVAAMQATENASKLHADTLRNEALAESTNYLGASSFADPLWLLYYRHEFDGLLNQDPNELLSGISAKEQNYLLKNGAYQWYLDECQAILERLNAARNTTLDRGSRIVTYHRLLAEYRKIYAIWDTKKHSAKLFLSLSETNNSLKNKEGPMLQLPSGRTDRQIADAILSKSKL